MHRPVRPRAWRLGRLYCSARELRLHNERCDDGEDCHHSHAGHSARDVLARRAANGNLAPGTRPNRLATTGQAVAPCGVADGPQTYGHAAT
jgi:hypothetical protein